MSPPWTESKKPTPKGGRHFLVAEWTGITSDVLSLALRAHGVRPNSLPANLSNPLVYGRGFEPVPIAGQKKADPQGGPAFSCGGVDGTRTRDPRRDRPVF